MRTVLSKVRLPCHSVYPPSHPPCPFEPLESRTLFSVPAGFTETPLATALNRPTTIGVAPDGRVFVSLQGGQLRVVKNGQLLSTPFATLPVDSSGERGLLGVTFDPNFATNRYVYVYWTVPGATTGAPSHNRISRLTANGDVAVSGSRKDLFDLPDLNAPIHNGGAMHFGPDGKLYVTVGENHQPTNSQSLSTTLGKVLRLNPDGSIPTDNPFYSQTTGPNRAIWALGLRNPFTFNFQPGTGRMFINDVGQDTWEEIDQGIAGANYGWPVTEGPTSDPRFQSPLYAYDHGPNEINGSAITGGTFYNPPSGAANKFPGQYAGDYFFSDYTGDYIKALDFARGNQVTTFATGLDAPIDLGVGPDGSLYYLARGTTSNTGALWRIRYTAGAAPTITSPPAPQTVAAGRPVTFSVTASGAAPLSYQWRRNNVAIPGATAASYTFTTQASETGAVFDVIVSNAAGIAVSSPAVLTVVNDAPPVPTIDLPVAGSQYRAGDVIGFSGSATDAEDGTLPASAFTWEVVFHHADHTHPFIAPFGGVTSGTFKIPTDNETSPDVFYRVHLTVTDSLGISTEVTRDILPQTAHINLALNVPGLKLTLDGTPLTPPASVLGVTGITRTLGAAASQTLNGVTYDFAGWSDGGSATHAISTPAADTRYTATYTPRAAAQHGLTATYYDNLNFTGKSVTRIDPTVNFNWGSGAPVSGFGSDTFSVRWTGQIVAPKTGTYTFRTKASDGVRLWVNNKLVINKFFDNTNGMYGGTISLTGGKKYSIRLDYFEDKGNAFASLMWSGPSIATQVIPTSQLYPG